MMMRMKWRSKATDIYHSLNRASIPSLAKIDHVDILEVGTGDHRGRILSMA